MKCLQCKAEILPKEKHLVCFYCKHKYHLVCLKDMKQEDFDYIIKNEINWRCLNCDKKRSKRGDDTPLTPVSQRSETLLKGSGSEGDSESSTGTKMLCFTCKKGFSFNAHKATCNSCKQLFHFKCTSPEMSKEEYFKVKNSWVCGVCAGEDSRKQLAPDPALATKVVATDKVVSHVDKSTVSSDISLSDIFKEMISFRNEVKETNKQFKNSLEQYSDWMEENTRKIDDAANKITSVLNSIETLFQENANLKKTVNNLTNKLQALEQQEFDNDVEIHGVPYEKEENILNLLGKMSEVISFNFKEEMIGNCFRYKFNNMDPAKPTGIVVRFLRKLDKIKFIDCRRKKRNLNSRDLGFQGGDGRVVYVNDRLTRERRNLLMAARDVKKAKNYTFLWVRNGRIFLRKNEGDRYVIVNDVSDLDKLA